MTSTRKRLLRDIAELERKPYPNTKYTPYEDDITKACLVLTPAGYSSLHFTVSNLENFPLSAPHVQIETEISHPNVIGNYVCASILNTREGWTPAYTLKGICIQLLSFFGSDRVEQMHGGGPVSLASYKDANRQAGMHSPAVLHTCIKCGFDNASTAVSSIPSPPRPLPPGAEDHVTPKTSRKRRKPSKKTTQNEGSISNLGEPVPHPHTSAAPTLDKANISTLPDELVAHICSFLETEELVPLSRAWDRIGGEQGIVNKFNIIRNRELICFCLKKGFEVTKLGVGVRVEKKGRFGTLESEFDLLSVEAFENLKIRNAVHGNPFQHWLPLPISRRHYNSVQSWVLPRLKALSGAAGYTSSNPEDIVYGFMSDIVVRLSNTTETVEPAVDYDPYYNPRGEDYYDQGKSTLRHASEKAIESYYHLFHLLLCLATSDPRIVRTVNQTLKSFLDGNTSKTHVPNLGQLLIAVLISDADMTKDLLMAIIRETITRNVVWMLDKRGAGMPELAYMEADEVSQYRLQKTFDASKTSYRLLMFLNLFRRTINRGTPDGQKSLIQLRDELFDAHGAPPTGTAARLASDIKKLQQVKSFPEFLVIMGLTPPSGKEFTSFLRRTLEESVKKGYSCWGITQRKALTLRQQVDPRVQVRPTTQQKPEWYCSKAAIDFFPGKAGAGGKGRGGGVSGRGRGT